ncbi:branched-chain amino acid aminotransferase [Paenibacillus koleovorans]|uniref:branched-chain amino acid aminotransferase n=1 Tax=Paenibacillus koleovorans TaxID=121608 RepID=UPI000FDC93BE|nr:branched-chain amino acid aminotransferase [Paenibacillus koleovorans]
MPTPINVQLAPQLKAKPDQTKLGFGQHFTDHMFVMDYTEGTGWHDPRIVPYGKIELDPAAMVLHYGQAVFEGLKAFRTEDGRLLLFRPDQNMARLNRSNDRLSIPPIDGDFIIHAIKELVNLEKDWVPAEPGTSLYIRPYIFATEACLGVRASYRYLFMVILSPVGAYYAEGIKPVRINVENDYVRAVRGGTGNAKTAGNYAASIKAQEEAKEEGYAQVLWLDGVEKKYIEEVGSMNVFFKVNGEVVTPELNGSILQGVTRASVIEVLKSWDLTVTERRISIEELYEASLNGTLEEAFGTGTAAVISPVGELNWGDKKILINNGQIGEIAQKLYNTITGIQNGSVADTFGWTVQVETVKA